MKLGVRSIEESDQKDVDADRGHIPWTASVRENLRRVNHNYCGILYYIFMIVTLDRDILIGLALG